MAVDINHWAYYQTKTLGVFPYMAGVPVFCDGMLPFLYTQAREEGKIEDTFCGDNLIQDAFVDFFHKRKTLQVLAEIEDDKTIKPVGFSWLDNPRGVDGQRAAMCGFCFFNNASKRDLARNLARLGLAYWMIAMKVDVIHGVQLESNVAARNFALRLGFREAAVVPKYHYSVSIGELVGARVMIIEKTDFVPAFENWFDSQKVVAETV
jgi:RimJ/RimL family protein N-acetyltransferase